MLSKSFDLKEMTISNKNAFSIRFFAYLFRQLSEIGL